MKRYMLLGLVVLLTVVFAGCTYPPPGGDLDDPIECHDDKLTLEIALDKEEYEVDEAVIKLTAGITNDLGYAIRLNVGQLMEPKIVVRTPDDIDLVIYYGNHTQPVAYLDINDTDSFYGAVNIANEMFRNPKGSASDIRWYGPGEYEVWYTAYNQTSPVATFTLKTPELDANLSDDDIEFSMFGWKDTYVNDTPHLNITLQMKNTGLTTVYFDGTNLQFPLIEVWTPEGHYLYADFGNSTYGQLVSWLMPGRTTSWDFDLVNLWWMNERGSGVDMYWNVTGTYKWRVSAYEVTLGTVETEFE